jgi:hypothetical protein
MILSGRARTGYALRIAISLRKYADILQLCHKFIPVSKSSYNPTEAHNLTGYRAGNDIGLWPFGKPKIEQKCGHEFCVFKHRDISP